MTRRFPTQLIQIGPRQRPDGRTGSTVVLALANDGTMWETAYGSGKWTLCEGLPQPPEFEWGTGRRPAAPELPPNTWGSADPPQKTEGAP